MYKEMKKIQTENRSLINLFQLLNGDKFPDFADFFFFGIKNVRVGSKILGSVGRSDTHIFFFVLAIMYLELGGINISIGIWTYVFCFSFYFF